MIDDLWYKGHYLLPSGGTYMDANGDGVGDFKGLLRRLDYLHGLGITAIWLMPFQPSPGKDDGYDITDYYASTCSSTTAASAAASPRCLAAISAGSNWPTA